MKSSRWFLLLASCIVALLACWPAAAAAADPPEPAARVDHVKGVLGLHRTITVGVTGLPVLLRQAEGDISKIVLHIDGYPFHGMTPRWGDEAAGELLFDLTPTTAALPSWKALANASPGTTRRVSVSVAVDGHPPIATNAKDYLLLLIELRWLVGYFVLLTLNLIGLVQIARNTDLLREPGAPPAGVDARGKPLRKAYSLSRTQMAFWFFLVIAAYVFIVMLTGIRGEIPTSILALIGISSGTCLGAVAIDSSKTTAAADEGAALEKTRAALEVEIAGLGADIADLEARAAAAPPPDDVAEVKKQLAMKQEERRGKQAQSAALREKIAAAGKVTAAPASVSFVLDILSDANGVSFHRLQMATWTVVLGGVFVVSAYRFLMMPDFDMTLLGLMGLSNGTYIGFKFPEQKG